MDMRIAVLFKGWKGFLTTELIEAIAKELRGVVAQNIILGSDDPNLEKDPSEIEVHFDLKGILGNQDAKNIELTLTGFMQSNPQYHDLRVVIY